MPSQAEREANFIWRPSDNSVQTNLRYELESEKWYLGFEAARRKHNRPSFQETAGVIGLVLSFIGHLLLIVWLLGVHIVRWVRNQ